MKTDVVLNEDEIVLQGQDFLDSFKASMKKITEECLGEAYANCMPHIMTDTWANYREALRLELEREYKYSKFKNEWAKNLRRAIFVENREEISALISKDILERIKYLEDSQREFEQFRYM